jgi:AcrR family transcriptional regulator
MVATDAGLARPHLYRFFKNKAELIAAVVAVETSEINARRRQQIAELHSFADKLVRSLELAVELVYSDDFWSSLITPGSVPYTAYAASSAPEILAANTDYWTPMLRAAEDSGELRPSLDHQKVMTWLLGIQVMFMERSEIFPTIADVGYYARTFVLPALVVGTDG